MQKIIFSTLALSIVQIFMLHAETLEFLNKSKGPVIIAIGSRQQPLTYDRPGKTVAVGGKYSTEVDNSQIPQLMIKDFNPAARTVAFVYEFTPPKGKKIYVRLTEYTNYKPLALDDEKGVLFEPQSYVWNNLSKNDIKLIRTLSEPSQPPAFKKEQKQPPQPSRKPSEPSVPRAPGGPSFE